MGTDNQTTYGDIEFGNAFRFGGKVYWKTKNTWDRRHNAEVVSADPKERKSSFFRNNVAVEEVTYDTIRRILRI